MLGLLVVSSVLSMAIRQLRHLAEKPSDFLRLPFFIVFSTVFLTPLRLVGFFRMAHVAGWGTRSGAYTGDEPVGGGAATGQAQARTDDPLADELESLRAAPGGGGGSIGEPYGGLERPSAVLVRPRTAAVASRAAEAPQPARMSRRRLNPKAAWPYLIGLVILTGEAMLIV